MLKKSQTLNSKEFAAVISRGKGLSSELFFIKVLKNDAGGCRAGVGVSKKLTKSPVRRNYYKRVLRHILKETLFSQSPGTSYDVVLIMQPAAAGKKFNELKKDAEKLLRKIGNK